jgi:hypothetical protein
MTARCIPAAIAAILTCLPCAIADEQTIDQLEARRDEIQRTVRPKICARLREIRAEVLAEPQLAQLQTQIVAARKAICRTLEEDEDILAASADLKAAQDQMAAIVGERLAADPVVAELKRKVTAIEQQIETLGLEHRKANFLLHEARRRACADPAVVRLEARVARARQVLLDDSRNPALYEQLRLAVRMHNEAICSAADAASMRDLSKQVLQQMPETLGGLRKQLRQCREELYQARQKVIREHSDIARMRDECDKLRRRLRSISFERTADDRKKLGSLEFQLSSELAARMAEHPAAVELQRQRTSIRQDLAEIRSQISKRNQQGPPLEQ